jgi:hypothetical protein
MKNKVYIQTKEPEREGIKRIVSDTKKELRKFREYYSFIKPVGLDKDDLIHFESI